MGARQADGESYPVDRSYSRFLANPGDMLDQLIWYKEGRDPKASESLPAQFPDRRFDMRSFCLLVSLVCLASIGMGQDGGKRSLTHDDYDGWKSLSGRALSRDGRWVAYSVRPQVGDAELVVRATEGDVVYRHPLGSSPSFTADGAWLVFKINPSRAETLAYERSKLKKSKKPKKPAAKEADKKDGAEKKIEKPLASMGIMKLETGEVEVVARVKRFSVPAEGPSFAAWTLEPEKKKDEKKKKAEAKEEKKEETVPASEKPEPKAAAEKKEGAKAESKESKDKKADKKRKYLKDGDRFVLRNLTTAEETVVEGVVSFGMTRKKGWLWFACSSKKDKPEVTRGLFAIDLDSAKRSTLVEGGADYKSITFDREVTRMAFLSNRRDRDQEKPTYDLHTWDFASDQAKRIVSHSDTEGFPEGHSVSSAQSPRFSRDGGVLLFGAALLPREDLPPLLAEEKVTLDIWHWKDPLLQPMQAKQAQRIRNQAIACVHHFDHGRMVVLGKKASEQVSFIDPEGSRALVRDGDSYMPEISWDARYTDLHLVNTIDGSRREIAKRLSGRSQTSPDGRWLVFFREGDWFAIDLVDGYETGLTRGLGVDFAREDWDTPQPARAYGIAGWTKDDAEVLIYDRYDIWKIDPKHGRASCVTDGFGRANDIRLRWTNLDSDRRFVPAKAPLLLAAFNEETMASGYYHDRLDGIAKPKKIVMRDKSYGGLAKAKDAERYFFTLTSFNECGDIWTSKKDFRESRRLSDINPQQKDIRWGTAELVKWRSADGVPLKGILMKPEGFDPSKKYPMMVYFYEKRSSSLHRYRTPGPGTSPNPIYYVSNDYLWFIPDIVYRDGYPGESCLKCVVSGVQKLIERGFVQEDAIGAAGHSWGGYQTAYLVTRTNIFKAVESGAPVSNMTSAYGGIRWGSGMSRAFQYERTQSRIGGSLWRYPLRYLENSPIFTADKIETPVLMLHNDQDGAVPWYQGIEFFCALRRLDKEVYMFNYNGSGHGLRKRANTMDWTKRMQQYFDHHLRGKEMPKWMSDGVPFVERQRSAIEFRPPRHSVTPTVAPAEATPTAVESPVSTVGSGSFESEKR